MERENAWSKYNSKAKMKSVMDFGEDYRAFLSVCKTERECNDFFVEKAKEAGYKDLFEVIKANKKLKCGDKVYASNNGKELVMFNVGSEDLSNGISILGAHIDSPRMDLKQNPLYEDSKLAMLDTHYYGGIKKYQWVAVPLALHGVIVKSDCSVVKVNIGEEAGDPVFGVSDILIHLADDQFKRTGNKIVEGEDLNVMVGSIPLIDKDNKEVKEAVKANVLKLLEKKYKITEEDFLSAEIEVVPAGPARDYGFDSSMVMGYGHDDRVCAYSSFRAFVEMPAKPKKTQCCLLVDKEEIGSVGATGMQSSFFENMVAELYNCMGNYSELGVRRCLANSKALSSDVSAAFDPNYASVFEKKNAAFLGNGLVFNKYTGARGKSGSNDASAEYVGEVRKIMNDNKVSFQTAELGKVDAGGGGTIAYILGNMSMKVIDSGVAVMNMHAPWEIISKVDLYEAFLGYKAFLKDA